MIYLFIFYQCPEPAGAPLLDRLSQTCGKFPQCRVRLAPRETTTSPSALAPSGCHWWGQRPAPRSKGSLTDFHSVREDKGGTCEKPLDRRKRVFLNWRVFLIQQFLPALYTVWSSVFQLCSDISCDRLNYRLKQRKRESFYGLVLFCKTVKTWLLLFELTTTNVRFLHSSDVGGTHIARLYNVHLVCVKQVTLKINLQWQNTHLILTSIHSEETWRFRRGYTAYTFAVLPLVRRLRSLREARGGEQESVLQFAVEVVWTLVND